MAFLSVLDTLTRKSILPGAADLFFKNDPFLAHVKANCLESLPAENFQENIFYDSLTPVAMGANQQFDMTDQQIETGLSFTAREYGVPVSADLKKLNVDYYGEDVVYDYLDSRLENASKALSARMSIALFHNGQSTGRTNEWNGMEEALTADGVTSWNGNTFTAYGTVTRSSVNTALDPLSTEPSTNLAGPISYAILEKAYNSVVVGTEEPNLILTTNRGMSYIKTAFQSQQRFEKSDDVKFGFRGVSFNGATILQSQYAPGAAGVNDTKLGNYLDADGETLWILNVKRDHMRFYVSPTELFGFGFTGWKPAQNNLSVGGQYLVSGNFTFRGAKYSRYHFGITA